MKNNSPFYYLLPILLVMNVLLISFNANAQKKVDSVVVATDTSLVSSNSILIKENSGRTSFFTGGKSTKYAGNTGIGIDKPKSKLTVYDPQKASIRLAQGFSSLSNFRTVGSNSTLSNFTIDELATSPDGIRSPGSVTLSAFWGNNTNWSNWSDYYSSFNVGSIFQNYLFSNRTCTSFDPDMSFMASQFEWYTHTAPCSNSATDLSMLLTSTGDLLVNHNGKYGGTLTSTGAAINGTCSVVKTDSSKAFSVFRNSTENFVVWSDGKVRAREVKITLASPFPDYVFANDYKLMGIYDLEKYVNENKHLPDMPTAKEVATNGLEVGEQNRMLTQKIEELTLYIIDLQKQVDELKKTK